MNRKELYKKAKEEWGLNSQLLMLAEESTELSLACLHLTRNRKFDSLTNILNLAEEIADTEIMIAEIKTYFPGLYKHIKNYKRIKIKRLEELLKDVKNKNQD